MLLEPPQPAMTGDGLPFFQSGPVAGVFVTVYGTYYSSLLLCNR
jgi:hypothetical protein